MNDRELAERMFKQDLAHHTLDIICPDCGETDFLAGPKGGLSQNIRCANPECGAKFNIYPPHFAERI